jgi:hypothetical protein
MPCWLRNESTESDRKTPDVLLGFCAHNQSVNNVYSTVSYKYVTKNDVRVIRQRYLERSNRKCHIFLPQQKRFHHDV